MNYEVYFNIFHPIYTYSDSYFRKSYQFTNNLDLYEKKLYLMATRIYYNIYLKLDWYFENYL